MRSAIVAFIAVALGGCVTSEVRIAHEVVLDRAERSYPETELLDVSIVKFDSGVPEGEISRELLEELLRDGQFVNIRRAESIYLATTLRDTLQRSGYWGSVWVAPRDSRAVDLQVEAEILQSDGNILELAVMARDATGRVWLNRSYDMETAAGAYNRQRYPTLDPYQDVFNNIANDLAAARDELSAEQVADIRTIGELRYASELSPDAFGDYLEERNGVYEPVRLPAVDDPTLARTRAVRQREQLFIETLDQSYDDFTVQAMDSYDGWRAASREDSIRLREAARAAKVRTGLGALTVVMAIAYGRNSDAGNVLDRALVDSGVYIGFDMIQSAAVRRQERRLYQQSLQELSESFDDDVKPMVIDVQGTQHRLTGTADAQFDEWRELIQQLYRTETGFEPEDIDVYTEPDAAPEAPAIEPNGSAGGTTAGEPNTGEATTGETSAGATGAAEEPPSYASGGRVTGA